MADRTAWDAALLKYRMARILANSSEEFGPLAKATAAFDDRRVELINEFGSEARLKADPAGKAQWDAAFSKMQDAERVVSGDYYETVWAAANALVAIPAPDADALQIKFDIIKYEEVWNSAFEGDCFAIVKADAERLLAV